MGAMLKSPDLAKIVALDIFTGNGDRHRGNIFISGKGKERQFHAIDNGLAFRSEQCSYRFAQACEELNRTKFFFAGLDDKQREHLKVFVDTLKTLDQQNSMESLEKRIGFYSEIAVRQEFQAQHRSPAADDLFRYTVEAKAERSQEAVRRIRPYVKKIVAALEPHTVSPPPQRDEIMQIIDPHGLLDS
jgi:hypothetical protein